MIRDGKTIWRKTANFARQKLLLFFSSNVYIMERMCEDLRASSVMAGFSASKASRI
jgi:hypothetical protein